LEGGESRNRQGDSSRQGPEVEKNSPMPQKKNRRKGKLRFKKKEKNRKKEGEKGVHQRQRQGGAFARTIRCWDRSGKRRREVGNQNEGGGVSDYARSGRKLRENDKEGAPSKRRKTLRRGRGFPNQGWEKLGVQKIGGDEEGKKTAIIQQTFNHLCASRKKHV